MINKKYNKLFFFFVYSFVTAFCVYNYGENLSGKGFFVLVLGLPSLGMCTAFRIFSNKLVYLGTIKVDVGQVELRRVTLFFCFLFIVYPLMFI